MNESVSCENEPIIPTSKFTYHSSAGPDSEFPNSLQNLASLMSLESEVVNMA